MYKCPLCSTTVDVLHKKSHLIPEWMYKETYDKNHKMVGVELSKEKAKKRQNGFYDQIICKKCETDSQVFDHYASLVLTQRSISSSAYKSVDRKNHHVNSKWEKHHYSIWENLNFLKVQKFVFACLIRTHFSMKRRGKYLLVEKHFQKILELYKNAETLDDISYPIMVMKYSNIDGIENITYLPFINKKDGHFVIEFASGGYFFWVYVSSHQKPRFVNSLRLKDNGNLYILHSTVEETGTYKKVLPKLSEIAEKTPIYS